MSVSGGFFPPPGPLRASGEVFYFPREDERLGAANAWLLASPGGGAGAATVHRGALLSIPRLSTLQLFPALQTLPEIPEMQASRAAPDAAES